MRIVFIGCVKFSAAMITVLLDHPNAELVGIVTRTESSVNADFQNLHSFSKQADCPVFEGENQHDMVTWLHQRQPDIIYCIGWSRLLAPDILTIAPRGVVGYHPTALPVNRGRHPIIWTLALGLEKTASTFFLMNEHADAGDILSQQAVSIGPDDNAGDLYHTLIDIARHQLKELTSALAAHRVTPVPQNHSMANVWRKRTPIDGIIDWRMSAQSIHNLIRALAQPYPGADCQYGQHTVKIWRARLVEANHHLEPGKVLSVSKNSKDNHITIKCGEGAITLMEHDFQTLPREGSYL